LDDDSSHSDSYTDSELNKRQTALSNTTAASSSAKGTKSSLTNTAAMSSYPKGTKADQPNTTAASSSAKSPKSPQSENAAASSSTKGIKAAKDSAALDRPNVQEAPSTDGITLAHSEMAQLASTGGEKVVAIANANTPNPEVSAHEEGFTLTLVDGNAITKTFTTVPPSSLNIIREEGGRIQSICGCLLLVWLH
jgi:hypothetical protein